MTPGRGVVLVVSVTVAAVLAVVGVRSMLSLREPGPPACEGTTSLRVGAAPEIVPALRAVARDVAAADVSLLGECLRFEVTAIEPAMMFRRLAPDHGPVGLPDLWIPDSSAWLQRTDFPSEHVLSLSPSIAASPLVLATDRRTADELDDRPETWQELVRTSNVGDPEASGPAVAALLALHREDPGLEQFPSGPGIRAIPMTEQQVWTSTQDLAAVRPSNGTVLLDYPLVAIIEEQPDAGRIIEAGTALARYAGSRQGHTAFRTEGFRDFERLHPPKGVDADPVQVLPPRSTQEVDDVLRIWRSVRGSKGGT